MKLHGTILEMSDQGSSVLLLKIQLNSASNPNSAASGIVTIQMPFDKKTIGTFWIGRNIDLEVTVL